MEVVEKIEDISGVDPSTGKTISAHANYGEETEVWLSVFKKEMPKMKKKFSDYMKAKGETKEEMLNCEKFIISPCWLKDWKVKFVRRRVSPGEMIIWEVCSYQIELKVGPNFCKATNQSILTSKGLKPKNISVDPPNADSTCGEGSDDLQRFDMLGCGCTLLIRTDN